MHPSTCKAKILNTMQLTWQVMKKRWEGLEINCKHSTWIDSSSVISEAISKSFPGQKATRGKPGDRNCEQESDKGTKEKRKEDFWGRIMSSLLSTIDNGRPTQSQCHLALLDLAGNTGAEAWILDCPFVLNRYQESINKPSIPFKMLFNCEKNLCYTEQFSIGFKQQRLKIRKPCILFAN